jgi:uncharacterized protein (DUF1015 family)
MPDLRPFRALRYDPAVVGELAAVVAPPYDVIDDAYRDVLYDRSPYNVIRLILGREPDRYASAAAHFATWQRDGVLARDREPALYVYRQTFRSSDGQSHQRAGIIGAVRLEPFATGRIRPHERTLAAPKADRTRLLEACRANLSPIFGLYAGTEAAVLDLQNRCAGATATVDLIDDAGIRHRLWAVADRSQIDRAAEALSAHTLYIADGHHRYETALAYRDRLAAAGGLAADAPANFVMMFLCSMQDPGLVVLPTHRVLAGLDGFDPQRFLERLREHFRLQEFPPTAEGETALLDRLRAAGGHGHMGLALRGMPARYLASLTDRASVDRAAADRAAVVRTLDVTMLDVLVLRGLLGVEAAAASHDGRLTYVKGDREALAAVAGGADVAFLLKATGLDEVQAVCEAGETMPEKSTYFYPKLVTGLVFHLL